MPFITDPLRVVIARQSVNGRYEGRWPAGDRPSGQLLLSSAAAISFGSGGLVMPSVSGSRIITGSGFGGEPTIINFDRANGTDGSAYSLTSDIGQWTRFNDVGAGKNTDVRYLTHAGRTWMAGRQVSLIHTSSPEIGGVIKQTSQKYTEYYLEYRVVVPTGRCLPGASPNVNSKTWTDTDSRWKLAWAWNSSYSATTTTDCVYPTMVSGLTVAGNAMVPRYGNAVSNSSIAFSLSSFSAVNENVLGTYVKIGSSDTSFDGVMETLQANGVSVTRTVRTNVRPFHGLTNPLPEVGHDVFVFSAWSGNVDQTNVQHGWADLYLAVGPNSQARVYTHNAPTMAASTQIYNVTACKANWLPNSIALNGILPRESLPYMSVIAGNGTLYENVDWS